MAEKVTKTVEQWQTELGPERFNVCRVGGTERAFTGALWDEHRDGTYFCAACGQELFTSETKFESGSGWPSFFQPSSAESVAAEIDTSHGMRRVEVKCSRCDSHLGHVFDDGPAPTRQRYCINSASLRFEERG